MAALLLSNPSLSSPFLGRKLWFLLLTNLCLWSNSIDDNSKRSTVGGLNSRSPRCAVDTPYGGELTPTQTHDLMSTRNHLMIDIRSEKDKNKAGIPRLPSSAKNRMIAIPLEESPSKLKGLVRNAKNVEAEIAALKISYLKKINKGSNIVIMDSYSDSSKIVARKLTSLGFKNCWTVADGFSGRNGWLQSRLGTDSYGIRFAEVLSPSKAIPAVVRRFGTTSSAKLLPGSSD